jgi:hypothetical protein
MNRRKEQVLPDPSSVYGTVNLSPGPILEKLDLEKWKNIELVKSGDPLG